MNANREDQPSGQASGRVFVGRQTELAALRTALDRALAGRGAVCLVAGEPGIGKSELADRLATEATARGAEVLWGRSWEGEGAPPYWPWAQIIRAYIEERPGIELEAIFGAATVHVAQIIPEIRERLPDLPVPSTLDSEGARFRLFDAVTTFLRSAAGARPLVLVLDDLHWADKPTLLLLRFLAREVAATRLFVVGDDESDSALRAQVMGRLSAWRVFMGDAEGNPASALNAIAMARRLGDKVALAHVLNTTMWAAGGPDDQAERLDRTTELIRLAEEIGDARLAAEGHVWKGRHHLEMGDVAAADRQIEIQERFGASSRQAYHRWLSELARGSMAFVEGRFDEAEVFLTSALQIGLEGVTFVRAVQGNLMLLHEQQGLQFDQLSFYEGLAGQYPVFVWRLAAARMRLLTGRVDEVRRDLEAIAANDFSDVPRDMTWLFNMGRVSELVIMLGDARRAAVVYELLLPYADRCVVLGGFSANRGSVHRFLGGLGALQSRFDEAERHFEYALAVNARIRARIWVAHTQYDYARMLIARDRPGDREKAAVLATQALTTAREVGMKPLEASVLALTAEVGLGEEHAAAPSVPTVATAAVFRRDGDFWTIAYDGKRIRLRDAKGLQYIAHLLRHDGRELHAADLAAGIDGTPSTPGASDEGGIAAGLGDAGEALDPSARAAYRQRLQELEAELAEATEWADAGRTAKLQTEIEFVRDELSGAYGLGGRARKAADVGDRARKAVTSRIRESIDRIGKEHPALARHLENAIRTGTFCGYQPDRPIRWEL